MDKGCYTKVSLFSKHQHYVNLWRVRVCLIPCTFFLLLSSPPMNNTDETFKKGVEYRLAGNEAFKKADFPEGEHMSSRIRYCQSMTVNTPFSIEELPSRLAPFTHLGWYESSC